MIRKTKIVKTLPAGQMVESEITTVYFLFIPIYKSIKTFSS